MNLPEIIYSRLGPPLGVFLGRILTARQAYALAEYLARRLARQSDSRMSRAIRSNQATARGLSLDDPSLDDVVLEVLRVSAIAYADLFRNMAQGVEAVRATSTLDDCLWDYIAEARSAGTGVIAVGAHLVGFDSILLTLKSHGLNVQALAAAELRGAYQVQNFIRRRYGLDVTPVSYHSLRQALQNLRSGGIVLTGVDFPIPEGDPLHFFGRTTRLPTGHARLALATQAPVIVALPQKSDLHGRYHVELMPPIYAERTGDQRRDTLVFSQRILLMLEDRIRSRPAEWLMFNPLWPEDLRPEFGL